MSAVWAALRSSRQYLRKLFRRDDGLWENTNSCTAPARAGSRRQIWIGPALGSSIYLRNGRAAARDGVVWLKSKRPPGKL